MNQLCSQDLARHGSNLEDHAANAAKTVDANLGCLRSYFHPWPSTTQKDQNTAHTTSHQIYVPNHDEGLEVNFDLRIVFEPIRLRRAFRVATKTPAQESKSLRFDKQKHLHSQQKKLIPAFHRSTAQFKETRQDQEEAGQWPAKRCLDKGRLDG